MAWWGLELWLSGVEAPALSVVPLLLRNHHFTIFLSGNCKVVSTRCKFPFEHNGADQYSCIKLESASLNEYDTGASDDWFCKNSIGERQAWGKCNDGCLDDDKTSENFAVPPVINLIKYFWKKSRITQNCEFEKSLLRCLNQR